MRGLESIQQRLNTPDMRGFMLLYALSFTTVFVLNYPQYPLNEAVGYAPDVAWSRLLTCKLLYLCCIALGYGLRQPFSKYSWTETLLALLSLLVLALPLDMVSYTLMRPDIAWWWLSLLSVSTLLGYMGLGTICASMLRRDSHALVVLIVPLLLLACFAIDFMLKRALLLPWLVQPQHSIVHVGIMLGLFAVAYAVSCHGGKRYREEK